MKRALELEVRQLINAIIREQLPVEMRPALTLADIRHRKLLDIDEASRSAGMSRNSLYHYEAGKLNSVRHQSVVHNLKRLASVYGCSFDEIVCATKQSIKEARQCSRS